MNKFSHVDDSGKAKMVDVSHKADQIRVAKAEGFIQLSSETIQMIRDNKMKKGDVLTVAEIAGIMGGKKNSELIPLCHPLPLSKVELVTEIMEQGVRVESMAKCIGQTGVEMEALMAVNVALLTVYDMCKAVDKEMVLSDIKLIEKTKTDISK
jgi:cyclic pyranopterin monophosphate synthase